MSSGFCLTSYQDFRQTRRSPVSSFIDSNHPRFRVKNVEAVKYEKRFEKFEKAQLDTFHLRDRYEHGSL
jgi:hypothetical protein